MSGETVSGIFRAVARREALMLRMFAGVGGFGRGMEFAVCTSPTGAIAAAPRRLPPVVAGSAASVSARVVGCDTGQWSFAAGRRSVLLDAGSGG